MQSISPVLEVRDVDASMAYYREVLDFPEGNALRLPNGKPVHGMVRWESVVIQFSPEMGAPVGASRGAGVIFYMHVSGDDIDSYFQKVVGRGAEVVEDIKTQDWGDRTFTVADPDGYRLTFAKQVRNVSLEDMQKALG